MNKELLEGLKSKQPNAEFNEMVRNIFFKDKTDGVAVECGAHCGWGGSVCYGFEELGWTVYNLEANNQCYEYMHHFRPNANNREYGLWHTTGEVPLLLPEYKQGYEVPGGSSMVLDEEYFGEKYTFKTVMSQVKTYKDFVEENGIAHIDCFVLDVEGAEMDVLKGIGDCKVLPDVWVIEDPKTPEQDCSGMLKAMRYKRHGGVFTNNRFWYKEGLI